MNNNKNGILADYLSFNEVEFSQACAKELQSEKTWQNFLNIPIIKKSIALKRQSGLSGDELRSIKSALFEIRVAHLIHKSGLNAEYEFSSNTDNKKTVDFRVFGRGLGNKTLLIELSSLRESQLQKDKTWVDNEWFGCMLDTDGNNDAREYIRAQSVLIEKALKFSDALTVNQFNIILLDMRSIILTMSDCHDYYNILYGSDGLAPHLQRQIGNKLFEGIFCAAHPEYQKFEHLRETIYCFGFVNEQRYEQNELARKIQWLRNPELICNGIPKLKEIFGDYRT